MTTSEKKSAAKTAPAGKGAKLVPASLVALDTLEADTLVLVVAEDERPLQGAAGLLDWRMCGWLTQQFLVENFRGKRGEKILTWPAKRVPTERVIILGAGPAARVVDGLGGILSEAANIVEKAGCKAVAIAASCPGAALQKAVGDAPSSLQDRVRVIFDDVA